MLKIHKPNRKLLIISITSILSISVLLGLYGLTYTSELSHAETVVYPEPEIRTMADITYMQDITPDICQNSELNKQYTLTDSRDGKTYTVAHIKNQTNEESNCWMTQNLAIIDKTIDSTNSDMKENSFIVPKSNISGFTSSDIYQNKAYLDTTYGGYYNWYTATAGTGTASITTPGYNTVNSICSKGWRLPTGGNSGEFYALSNSLTAAQIMATPYNYQYSGNVSFSSLESTNQYGFFWSSTIYDYNIYGMRFDSSDGRIHPSSTLARSVGFPIRCLARTESIPNNNVEVTINNTISLDVTSEVVVEKGDTNPSTAALPVSVASNQPYSVSISSTNPSLTSSTSSTTIPSISGNLTSPTNAWGIKLSSDTNYTQITSTPATFYTATGAEIKTIPFTVGISTSPDLPNGEYSTNITVTATQN